MDHPKKIARLIHESPDISHKWERCTCGSPFASIDDDNTILCLNRQCPNYSQDYANTMDVLIDLDPEGWLSKGVLTTIHGNEIKFIGLLDKGHYYVVFIPHRHTAVWKRSNPRKHLKYQYFATIENVWPWPPASQERLDRLIELNAPQILIQRERGKLDGTARNLCGAWAIKWEAKTITIRKDSVVDIDIF